MDVRSITEAKRRNDMPMVNRTSSTSISLLARSILHMAIRAIAENPNAMDDNRLRAWLLSSISDPLVEVCMCSSSNLRAASTLSSRSSGASGFWPRGRGFSSEEGMLSGSSFFIACIIAQLARVFVHYSTTCVQDSLCMIFGANPLISLGLVYVDNEG